MGLSEEAGGGPGCSCIPQMREEEAWPLAVAGGDEKQVHLRGPRRSLLAAGLLVVMWVRREMGETGFWL